MINYLYANNYKSFVNFKIEFKSLNLILGKNGSGKSNVFMLVFSLLDIIKGNTNAINTYFPTTSLTRWMKSNIQTFELGLSDSDHSYVYRVEILQDLDKSKGQIISEKISCDEHILYSLSDGNAILYDDGFVGTAVLTDNSISGISFAPTDSRHSYLNAFRNTVQTIILCSPEPKNMRGIVEKEELGARVNLSNIASIYSGMVQMNPELYGDLMRVLREINPSLKRLSVSLSYYGRYLQAEYEYNGVQCLFDFDELSDGEKMTFALYLLLYGFIKRGYTVLLDEPDNYLALREIQPWCHEMEDELLEGGQCVIISHHPEMIDSLAANSGIWMSRLKSGETVIIEDPQRKWDNTDALKYSELIARGLFDETE